MPSLVGNGLCLDSRLLDRAHLCAAGGPGDGDGSNWHSYQRQHNRDLLGLELSRSRPQDPVGGGQKRIADNDRPEVGDRATENDDKHRSDRSGDKPRSPQSQRRYPSVLQP